MQVDEKKILLIGLPESGKSTFTAALWGVINSNEIPESLKLTDFSGDDTYLNNLYKYWSRAEELPRTLIPTEGMGILALAERNDSSSNLGKLIIPDLAGERFLNQWEKRKINHEHNEHLSEINSILFFIHGARFNKGVINNSTTKVIDSVFDDKTTESLEKATASLVPVQNASVDEKKKFTNPEKPFSMRDVPTQTILVDLFQTTFLVNKSIQRVAIIISAWDIVMKMDEGITPTGWLKKKMPFLMQYLKNSTSQVDYKLWGISAQGGNLDKKGVSDREKLLPISPVKRIIVTDGQNTSNDITAPIRWLFADSK